MVMSRIFKMSEKPEGSTGANQATQDEEKEDNSKSQSLKEATHKLKAEALRRLQLEGGDYDENKGATIDNETREDSFDNAKSSFQDKIEEDRPREVQQDKSDVSVTEKDKDVHVSRSIVDANEENVGFGQNFGAKQNDNISQETATNLEDRAKSRSFEQNQEGSDKQGDQGKSEGKVNTVTEGNVQHNQVENTDSGKITSGGSNLTDLEASDAQKGALPGSRPGSGVPRAGLDSEAPGKVEEGKRTSSSRPGSGKSRSRPGSGSRRSQQEGKSRSRSGSISGRPDSGEHSRPRPQSGDKKAINEAHKGQSATTDSEAFDEKSQLEGDPQPEERKDELPTNLANENKDYSRGKQEVPGTQKEHRASTELDDENLANKDKADVFDEKSKLQADDSQVEQRREEISGTIAETKTTFSKDRTEGESQILHASGGSVEQGKDPSGDTTTPEDDDKFGDIGSVQRLSKENKMDIRQTEDDDTAHNGVSPPVNENVGFRVEGSDSKQNSNSFSNNKQEPERSEAGTVNKETPSSTIKDDKEQASSSDQSIEYDTTSRELKDVRKATQAMEGKSEKTENDQEGKGKVIDQNGSWTDTRKTQEDETSENVQPQADQGGDKKGDNEGSSSQQTAESEMGDTSSTVSKGKLDDSNEKENKEDSTKEGREKGASASENEGKDQESGKDDTEPQAQDTSGKHFPTAHVLTARGVHSTLEPDSIPWIALSVR